MRGASMIPEHRGGRVPNGHRIDVSQLVGGWRGDLWHRVDAKCEADILRVRLCPVVPAGPGVDLEGDGERIAGPIPALREARLETHVPDRIQRGADDCEVVVDDLGDLSCLCCE